MRRRGASGGIGRLAGAGLRGLALAAASLLAGCGGSQHPAPAADAAPKAHLAPPERPVAKALAGMVDAVGPSRSDPPVNLKFRIRDRPVVGQDDEIKYALIPQAHGLQGLRVAFGSLGGLTVVSHVPAMSTIKPASGVPIFGSVIVKPDRAGLFTLTAAVAVESASQTVMWNFNIPVIAGQRASPTAADRP
ncbi:MAG: hypothetical protein HIU85_03620 [Proteobacteria bacterium]|nr:hypothetical protein [Pseudomonadota bacterium]